MKVFQIGTENDENSKIFQFLKVFCIVSRISIDFVDWNVGKGQQVKNVLSIRLSEKIIAAFQVKISQSYTKNDRTQNFPIFNMRFDFFRGLQCVK